MPPEPLPWDRKELFRDRDKERGSSSSSSSRWRDSSSYVGSRNFNNNNHNSDFSPRWGFPSSDFRRPPGHVKQGGWHMYPEDHGYSTPRSGERFMDDDVFRPSGMRGDGRYGRYYRDNRPSFGQKDWRGHSWEVGHHQHSSSSNGVGRPHITNDQRLVGASPNQQHSSSANGVGRPHSTNDQRIVGDTPNQQHNSPANGVGRPHVTSDQRLVGNSPNHQHTSPANRVGRPHITNDQRLVGESPKRAAHPNSDPCGQILAKDQVDRSSDVNGSGVGQKVDKENLVGTYEWNSLKWSRSRSLTSRGSGFSHSSSSKSIGGESNDVKGELPPKNSAPVQSPSGDGVPCVAAVAPSEEASSRKKPRLGWGEGLAKYEKKKVDGPEDSVNKAGNAMSVSNVEPSHSLTSNPFDKSPKVTGFSDCSSPVTPSSFACSSSPGLEDKTFGKSVDVEGDTSNFSVSSMPVPESQPEGSHFSLEKLDLNSITTLGSMLTELLQADDQCSMDSGFMRSLASNKLLLWKGDISKALEVTETEIDSLEKELTSLKADTIRSFHCPASSNSGPADCKDGQSDGLNVFPRPHPLEVVTNGDIVMEDKFPCDDARGVNVDSRHEDIDSPGTATSKFVDPPVQISPQECKSSSGETDSDESTKRAMEILGTHNDETNVGTSCQSHDRNLVLFDISTVCMDHPNAFAKKEDNLFDTISACNKESADRAAKLLPSCDYSMEASRIYCLPAEPIVQEKFLRRKQSLRFKERVLALKFKTFHHLWTEDLRLLSLRSHRSKPPKKQDLSSRTLQIGSHKHRSSIRSRLASPGSSSLVPTTEIINFTSNLLSDSQVKVYRSSLKMPAMILDEKERMTRFVSTNGLVEDPCAIEKERSLINPWTAEEKEIFMDKLSIHGKDFRKIASFLDHKSTAECIDFYYKNHKSECFEKIKKKKLEKPLSASTYMVTSGKKWSLEMNAASLDILGAAAAQADQALETSKMLLGKSSSRKSRGSEAIIEASNSFCGPEDERETAAADVLAGICGSLSSEAMSSCITSSVDPADGNQDWKQQKVGSAIRRPLTPEVTQNVDDSCSDESCGEMDPADWTDDEKSLFVRAFSSHGKDFSIISRYVGTKSRDQCKVFFSKARKCLGLDTFQTGSGHGGTNASNGTNGGGSDTEDAGIVEMGSVVCSDKSGSRMDEDLLHVNQDVSKPDAGPELNMVEDDCGPEQFDHKDAVMEIESLLPNANLDVSDPVDSSGVVDDPDKDSATAAVRTDIDAKAKMDATIGNRSADDVAPRNPGVMDVEAAPGISDIKSEARLFSAPVELARPSTSENNADRVPSGAPPCKSKGFPLDLSIKANLHDVVTHTVGSESIIGHPFQDSFLRKCNRTASHNSIPELALVQQNESDLGSSCSSKVEKPACRNGDVKLFGKILSKTSSIDKENSNEKPKHHPFSGGKSSANQDSKGNPSCFADDHNSFLGLENVPIRSYGFWDGTKIQTGLPSFPDSALLLAKYPAAFANYSISSPKSDQQPLQVTTMSGGNECNMNGACVFSPREFSNGNGGVIDYAVLRNQEGLQPFRLEEPRNSFEPISGLPQKGKGLVKLNVVQGVGGSCTGITDPVAALKLHYASQQFGGSGGMIREETWRSQGGDVGR
ncbi:unnamed protein product [Amaranthus hypochondriacus]